MTSGTQDSAQLVMQWITQCSQCVKSSECSIGNRCDIVAVQLSVNDMSDKGVHQSHSALSTNSVVSLTSPVNAPLSMYDIRLADRSLHMTFSRYPNGMISIVDNRQCGHLDKSSKRAALNA